MKYISGLLASVRSVCRESMLIFQLGTSAVMLVLSGILLLTEHDISAGSVGVTALYAPMTEYPLMTLLIVALGAAAVNRIRRG